jgi:hypothetical protein
MESDRIKSGRTWCRYNSTGKCSGVCFAASSSPHFQHGKLHLSGNLVLPAQPKIPASWLRSPFRKDCHV